MVLDGVVGNFNTDLMIIYGNLNAQQYIDILSNSMLPF